MKEYLQYISINPEIRFGKPCIKGTRITVSDILGWLASGMSHEEILEDYPSLKEEHIKAALSFAANRETMVKIIVG
ncbi:MAG TPA: DUF433 domain-containing protein [Chitinophagaceae bacterium]|jgi:uncharacterized protein (DUF433 family)